MRARIYNGKGMKKPDKNRAAGTSVDVVPAHVGTAFDHDVLQLFHAPVREWIEAVFPSITLPQKLGWPAIARGESTLVLAPTGTGKTLAAFLWCIDRLMFSTAPEKLQRCRVVYLSPIKALAVDIDRNLRAPLIGIAQAAQRAGTLVHEPTIAIRTGDTPTTERARFLRQPADILITTPESLYLLLTSNARESLRSVETVIVDEIHALVPSKRGSHLALSLERLEHLTGRRLQRIGLSATQRPLEEVARFLGGVESSPQADAKVSHTVADAEQEALPEVSHAVADEVGQKLPEEIEQEEEQAEEATQEFLDERQKNIATKYRPVTIIDASAPKRLDLRVEVPVEDMSRLDALEEIPSGAASQGPRRPSIWSAIHPQLLQLVREHRSTLIFVNSRRLAERISGAINELAGEVLVRAHHGSVAVAQRKDIEDRLKLGTLKGIVATSSLELGIDMGAIDLVIQIESPTSVASGMQRIGRANHNVGAVSNAIIFPKFRADLVACAAITRAMYEGDVESVHYPRNPLDVLAQQIVAMAAQEPWGVEELFRIVRKAAPYASLPREVFDSVLDMLAGRYPSEEFAELRARINWDRIKNIVSTREGAKSVAIINGGTIPDRGLYGVFLTGAAKGARVGELDEEMVFESRAGDTIILGASTWRIDEISHNQVMVSPAPGEPGKMPFWKGDAPGRPYEFGQKIGKLVRELTEMPRPAAYAQLTQQHSLDPSAADNLLRYLEEQKLASERIPSDRDILLETCHDELGDRRVCVLTPFGSRVHAPLCMAATARMREEYGVDVESMWTDDGFVLRLPENDQQVSIDDLLPPANELRPLVLRQIGSTSLFAAKFREAAGRALLLPRRRPGMRTPLWQQRKRASDLLAVAARFSSFPILLETYRECMRDVFDLPAATEVLSQVQRGEIRVTTLQSSKPSPFAASLLFSYVANYIYDGDAPLAERRAQALSIDASQLEQLLGDNDLRELLDAAVVDEVEARLQHLEPEFHARNADGVHDLLRMLGDLTEEELVARCVNPEVVATVRELMNARQAVRVKIAGEFRYIAVELAARYRDALGTPLPPGLPEVFLQKIEHPLAELLRRYSRTHGPFTTMDATKRYDLPAAKAEETLRGLHGQGKLLEGEFRPRGMHQEWCDPEVLQQIRRKSLAKLRREVEPVEQSVFARFVTRWQGVTMRRSGLDALLDVVESLQGTALLASEVEREMLPARLSQYRPADLDALITAGEVVWVGLEQLGERDGRVALYLSGALPLLWRAPEPAAAKEETPELEKKILEFIAVNGASFFSTIHTGTGGGYANDVVEALWRLVWAGLLTNDTFQPVRQLLQSKKSRHDRSLGGPNVAPGSPEYLSRLRSRSGVSGAALGRWSLLLPRVAGLVSATEWSANMARQLLTRHGIVMRETAIAENIVGGYNSVYPALRTMEDSGWVRRGMFVTGLGAAQFAIPAAVDSLRDLRSEPAKPELVYLAATDPANPYGAILPWPALPEEGKEGAMHHSMSRSSGAGVILVNGALAAFLRRMNPAIQVFLPEEEPARSQFARELAAALANLAIRRQGRRSGLLIGTINGERASENVLGRFLEEAGFISTAQGFQMRRIVSIAASAEDSAADGQQDEEESA
jgi:ATP-dependent helicase Lhr and Lhr-like helicase